MPKAARSPEATPIVPESLAKEGAIGLQPVHLIDQSISESGFYCLTLAVFRTWCGQILQGGRLGLCDFMLPSCRDAAFPLDESRILLLSLTLHSDNIKQH